MKSSKVLSTALVASLIMLATLVAPTVLRANDITYTVNQPVGPGSVTGFIATDGTLGTISTTDFVGWNLILNDGYGDTTDLTPSNSIVGGLGSDLTATSSTLMFNFIGDGGILYFDSSAATFAGQLCYDGGTNCALPMGIDLYDVAGVLPCAYYGCNVAETGDLVIASTPEPGTISLMLIGVGMLGLVMRKRIAQDLQQTS